MKSSRLFLLITLAASLATAQMLPDQRRVDFEQLAGAIAKLYAPYQWKIEAFGYDALQIQPWLERIENVKDDLEYYEVCMGYVASLRDLHSGYFVHSDFTAELPLYVDYYDGKPLIEYIQRSLLPKSLFKFEIGDQLLAVDGQPVEDWVEKISKLQSFANPRATARWALDQIFYRAQYAIPRAHQIGKSATVTVLRAATGDVESYQISWIKNGTPLTTVGPVLSPSRSFRTLATRDTELPSPGTRMQERRTPSYKRLRGFGSVAPVFTLPPDFLPRYGRGSSDLIYSGSYKSDGYTIGYLRIPSFPSSPGASGAMLRAIDTEVAWFRENVDGLVLDVMRNPGGDVCLTNDILRRFIPFQFTTVGDELRPTLDVLDWFRQALQDGLDAHADQTTLLFLTGHLWDVETAYGEFRGITGPEPVCGLSLDLQPVRDSGGNVISFEKPLMVLIDEFSTSSADVFPAVLQDTNRALMFGMPTAGGGGLSTDARLGFYSEGEVTLSISNGTRRKVWTVDDLPPSAYIENIGARPDITVDYMTKENLMTGGKPFVDAFTKAMVEHIKNPVVPLPVPPEEQ